MTLEEYHKIKAENDVIAIFRNVILKNAPIISHNFEYIYSQIIELFDENEIIQLKISIKYDPYWGSSINVYLNPVHYAKLYQLVDPTYLEERTINKEKHKKFEEEKRKFYNNYDDFDLSSNSNEGKLLRYQRYLDEERAKLDIRKRYVLSLIGKAIQSTLCHYMPAGINIIPNIFTDDMGDLNGSNFFITNASYDYITREIDKEIIRELMELYRDTLNNFKRAIKKLILLSRSINNKLKAPNMVACNSPPMWGIIILSRLFIINNF